MNFDKVLIVGFGYVGEAMYWGLEMRRHDIKPVTVDPVKKADYKSVKEALDGKSDIDGVIVCVPTPQGEDMRCDDSIVKEVIAEVHGHPNYKDVPILIKSTVDIDTLREFENSGKDISFSPEFLRGRHAVDDFMEETKMIIGGNNMDTCLKWVELFEEGLARDLDAYFLSLVEAGYVKYAENAFLAMRVTFFNELFHSVLNIETDINKPGISGEEMDQEFIKGQHVYGSIVEALGMDPRIGHSHNQVPGPDGHLGWGGHCLPKDTAAWCAFNRANGGFSKLMEYIRFINFTGMVSGDNVQRGNKVIPFTAVDQYVDSLDLVGGVMEGADD